MADSEHTATEHELVASEDVLRALHHASWEIDKLLPVLCTITEGSEEYYAVRGIAARLYDVNVAVMSILGAIPPGGTEASAASLAEAMERADQVIHFGEPEVEHG